MPKRRDTGGRKAPRRPDEPAGPPEQAEVERAIEAIVERLKPRLDKAKCDKLKRDKLDTPAPRTPERKAGAPGRLSLVWDRDAGG